MSREVGMTFSAPMAGAIWRGEKWQTRRTSGIAHVPESFDLVEEKDGVYVFRGAPYERNGEILEGHCFARPRLRVGDVMVVREPWRTLKSLDKFSPSEIDAAASAGHLPAPLPPIWWADGGESNTTTSDHAVIGRYRQAMHMPLAFARSRRICTGVRVERLGDISEADADAEGADTPEVANVIGAAWSKRDCYFKYWEHLHGKGAFERDRRKWVFVYEFARRT